MIFISHQQREENNEINQLKDAIVMQYQILRSKSEAIRLLTELEKFELIYFWNLFLNQC